jgi:DNA-binding PadR family transcriptional regulator
MRDTDGKASGFLPLTEATYYVLVSLVEPRHGYGIMQNVAAISRDGVRLGPGTLYGALTNLLKQGIIERVDELEVEGERRKVYGLTGLGKRVLALECERLRGLARIGDLVLKSTGGKR